jgi:hypothetical protein
MVVAQENLIYGLAWCPPTQTKTIPNITRIAGKPIVPDSPIFGYNQPHFIRDAGVVTSKPTVRRI